MFKAPGPKALAALAAATAAVCIPAAAHAEQTVTLHAAFTPDRPGASTTISFGFEVNTNTGELPSPLTHVSLHMPAGMNYLTSTLGLDECEPQRLEKYGTDGCPPNSLLGFGSAFVEVPFGLDRGREIPDIRAVMGPPKNGNVVVLFYAEGQTPVSAQLVFAAELLPGSGLFGESLDTAVPLIPSVPDGPPVSIRRVQSSIGPAHLTYYKRVHGRRVPYHPRGVALPARCPRGGYRFSATFAFLDGSHATANSTVPCGRGSRK